MTGLPGSSGGSVTNAAPTMNATLTDTLSNVTSVQYAVDSQASGPFGSFSAPADFTAAKTVTLSKAMSTSIFNALSDGQHTVWVRSQDAAGNWGGWSGGYVTEKDTTPPSTTVVTATPSPTNAPPTINATITSVGSNNKVFAAEYFIDTVGANGSGTALGGTFGITPASPFGTLTQTVFNSLSDGTHTIYVHGQDTARSWGATFSTTFVKDMQIPLPTVTGPGAATNLNPIPFTVTFNVAVNGVDSSKITVTNGTVGTITGSGTTYTVNVTPTPTSAQTGETVTFKVLAGAAQNANDSSKSSTASNTVSLTYDSVAPAVTGGTYLDHTLPVPPSWA